MSDAPGPKVSDVQVFDAGSEFVAVEEMGTTVSGDTAAEALRGMAAALVEDGVVDE